MGGEEGALEICDQDGDQVQEHGSLNVDPHKSKSFECTDTKGEGEKVRD